jgi:exodeoxyribonuclease VII small subunit
MTTATKTELNFESSLEKLTQIVKRMESGELPLEEALKNFEEGVQLTRKCQEILTQAEHRVQQLMNPGESNPQLQNFQKP